LSARVQIIAIGSPFGADQIGWQVVGQLKKTESLKRYLPQLDFVRLDRPGAGLMTHLEKASPTVLIDAMVSGARVGLVRSWRGADIASAQGLLSSHGFGVRETIALAESLGALPPQLLVIGIEIDPEGEPQIAPPVAEIAAVLLAWLATVL